MVAGEHRDLGTLPDKCLAVILRILGIFQSSCLRLLAEFRRVITVHEFGRVEDRREFLIPALSTSLHADACEVDFGLGAPDAQHVTDLPHMSNVLVLRFSVGQGHLLTFGVRRPDVVQDYVSESVVDTKLSCTLRSSTIAQSGRGTPKRHPADAAGATCIRGYEPESLGLASEGRGRRGRPEQRRPPRGQARDGPKNIDEDITICRQVPEVLV